MAHDHDLKVVTMMFLLSRPHPQPPLYLEYSQWFAKEVRSIIIRNLSPEKEILIKIPSPHLTIHGSKTLTFVVAIYLFVDLLFLLLYPIDKYTSHLIGFFFQVTRNITPAIHHGHCLP